MLYSLIVSRPITLLNLYNSNSFKTSYLTNIFYITFQILFKNKIPNIIRIDIPIFVN